MGGCQRLWMRGGHGSRGADSTGSFFVGLEFFCVMTMNVISFIGTTHARTHTHNECM